MDTVWIVIAERNKDFSVLGVHNSLKSANRAIKHYKKLLENSNPILSVNFSRYPVTVNNLVPDGVFSEFVENPKWY